MPLPGGATDKIGNRYELQWTLHNVIKILRGEAISIRLEPPGDEGKGIEFWLRVDDHREYHQVKRQNGASGHWTLSELASEDVLENIFNRLTNDNNGIFVFTSTNSAFQLNELIERAKGAQSLTEFKTEFINSKQQNGLFNDLKKRWNSCTDEMAYNLLKRISIHIISEETLRDISNKELSHLASGNPSTINDILSQYISRNIHSELNAEDLWNHLDKRNISSRTTSINESISTEIMLRQLLAKQSLETSSSFIPYPEIDTPPLAPFAFVDRPLLNKSIQDAFSNATWIAIVDGPGKGKTQVARSIYNKYNEQYTKWISLRGIIDNHSIAFQHKITHWLHMAAPQARYWQKHVSGQISFEDVVKALTDRLGDHGFLVVDDLPDLTIHRDLFEKISLVSYFLSSKNSKLLTTSQRAIPEELEWLSSNTILTTNIPLFEYNDVNELLINISAPQFIREEKLIHLILSITKGLPAFVLATVYWIKKKNWKVGESELLDILSGAPIENIRESERRRMMNLLQNNPRNLLYRLSLIEDTFDKELIKSLASIQPSIDHYGACIDDLIGPWIERGKKGIYEVSPLFIDAGKDNLIENIQIEVHKLIAEYYIKNGDIPISKLASIAKHFNQAKEYGKYATILSLVMVQVDNKEQAGYVRWTAYVYTDSAKWPQNFPLHSRIMLRGAQIRLRSYLQESVDELQDDLDILAKESGPIEVMALIFAYSYAGPMSNNIPARIQLRRSFDLLNLQRKYSTLESSMEECSRSMIFISLNNVNDIDDLFIFLDEMRRSSDEQLSFLLQDPLAIETIITVIDKSTWSKHSTYPDNSHNWNISLEALDTIRTYAQEMNDELLITAEARARAIIHADYLDQKDEALSICRSISRSENPQISFIILYTEVCILFEMEQWNECIDLIKYISIIPDNTFIYYQIDLNKKITICLSKINDWKNAKTHCIKTIYLCKDFKFDLIEMLGELAWLYWNMNNTTKLSGTIFSMVALFIENIDTNTLRGREVFNKLGHAFGWMSAKLNGLNQELKTASGDKYTPIESGFFGVRRVKMGDHTPSIGFSKALLATQAGLITNALGSSRLALSCFDLAKTFGVSEGSNNLFVSGDIHSASLLARLRSPEEAIIAGLRGIKLLVLGRTYRLDMGLEKIDEDANKVWGNMSDTERSNAEQYMPLLVYIPYIIEHLGNNHSTEYMISVIDRLESAITSQIRLFTNIEYHSLFINTIRNITVSAYPESMDLYKRISEEESSIKSLAYMIISRSDNIPLRDRLAMQVYAFDLFLRIDQKERGIMPGLCKFIYSIWNHISERQSFLLNNPKFLKSEIEKYESNNYIISAIRILLIAIQSVGLNIDRDVIDRFRQIIQESA